MLFHFNKKDNVLNIKTCQESEQVNDRSDKLLTWNIKLEKEKLWQDMFLTNSIDKDLKTA